MGWLRFVSSLRVQVCFAKEPYKRDYNLQKRPIILRSLLIVATPYIHTLTCRIAWPRTHVYVWHDTWLPYMRDMTHYRVAKSHRMPYELQVTLHKRATNYRALLQKTTYEDKAPYDSTPPCTYYTHPDRIIHHNWQKKNEIR